MSALALAAHNNADAPVGIVDSGAGGLSVLRHVRAILPSEHLVYIADSGFAPYGEKPDAEVIARTLALADFLKALPAKAMVIACNTATAAAISAVRHRYPGWPVVGVEPGLKPAAANTTNGLVAVLATAGTLGSTRFAESKRNLEATGKVRFLVAACTGLADQIEKGELRSRATSALLERYLAPLLREGADTVVLGCTHYPFVLPLVQSVSRAHARLPIGVIDTGEAVGRQLARVLEQHGLVQSSATPGVLRSLSTGSVTALATAFSRLLRLEVPVSHLD
ncbi:MAG: murI [Herminiimonas sp.]|nr:murI [Herminiimonas sp.]MDB5852404.1 murI [Herminiimonas sp.]